MKSDTEGCKWAGLCGHLYMKEKEKQAIMCSIQLMRKCVLKISHCKFWWLWRSEMLSDFMLYQALMRYLAAPWSLNFGTGKPWSPLMHCRINCMEHINACFFPTFICWCPCVHTTKPDIPFISLDVWLRDPKAAYLNFNQFCFYQVSYLFIQTLPIYMYV